MDLQRACTLPLREMKGGPPISWLQSAATWLGQPCRDASKSCRSEAYTFVAARFASCKWFFYAFVSALFSVSSLGHLAYDKYSSRQCRYRSLFSPLRHRRSLHRSASRSRMASQLRQTKSSTRFSGLQAGHCPIVRHRTQRQMRPSRASA